MIAFTEPILAASPGRQRMVPGGAGKTPQRRVCELALSRDEPLALVQGLPVRENT